MAITNSLSPEPQATLADAFQNKAKSDYLLANGFCTGESKIGDEGVWGYAKVDNAYPGITANAASPVVELAGVTKRFGPDVLGLDDVSLRVAAGEVVVLLGLSGPGKSTLLRHVDGLQLPTSGSVRLLGVNGGLATRCHLLARTGIATLPDDLDDAVAAPANCATAIVVCVVRRLALRPEDVVLVVSCGMLGLSGLGYLRSIGLTSVLLACDVVPHSVPSRRPGGRPPSRPATSARSFGSRPRARA